MTQGNIAQLARGLIALLAIGIGSSAHALDILDAPTLGIPGQRSFSATPTTPDASISWQVDQETRSESGGGTLRVIKNVFSATGPQVSFDLTKVKNKQTVWVVRASDSGGADSARVQIFSPNKLSSFPYASSGNPDILVHFVAPKTLSPRTRFLIVLHGASRNSDDYCNYWRKWTIKNDTLVVCPRFDERNWPDGRGYNRGNVFADENDTRLNPESRWAYTVVDKLHGYGRGAFGISDEQYDLWGHSAGGQFIHRFLLFKPNAKVRLAMPANPGWYLVPDPNVAYQCGPKHPQLTFTPDHLLTWSRLNAVLFRGTLDTDPNDPETGGCMDAQGRGRFARAGYFFNTMKTFNPNTTWRLMDVPGVAHDGEAMAAATQRWLDAGGN
jgi:hypothetical protein